ncbi:hypothetical protein GUITHDRAFT_97443 [Guillardia theta CCMP2712]|uniref:MSP domain-containing protein n=2 Tax=Guillardia theta TaxID=55529 RepID=L1IKZ4_GUITC|nr:hypothetical protein GUITHDRAFT_97443 [Guillardia theta CCMP2712]ABW35313.2 Rab1A [Guillardia theta]EKX36911.1 hypothetical protein GUITHDRAFT_97443 [Guillardia theta CCMP2712]|mmetsp:Transcript_8483/g.28433  ORF Transcript_8483/g.28433 Transcript_8483/m.28433 type:complete len:531 (-) Transcript_8483:112-1704(-)|eukprot:XP_005823891.1 hypothetical protein GUITHDRAFT_97443 [Guillardia theta CCMP2712]
MLVEPLHLNLDLVDPSVSKQSVIKIITLVNSGTANAAFKIRTTARERYSTTPNSGLLGPGQECDIIVTMLPLSQEQYIDFSSTMSCTDKFLVRSCFTDESVTEDNVRGETAASWWNSRPKSELTDQVITCSYIRQATRVEVGQSKLRFQKERSPHKMVGTSRVLAEEILVLLNNTRQRQAFKIRTTARDRYRVEPSCGIVESGQKYSVRISMVQPRGVTSDKFQVRCVVADADTDETQIKRNEWWAEPTIKSKLYDTTLDSIYISDADEENISDKNRGNGYLDLKKTEPATTLAVLPTDSSINADEGSYDALLKIVLVGDSDVGKTSLLTRFSDDNFSNSFISTIGVDFRWRTMSIKDKNIKLQIWDTAGQERFRTITSAYYRGADGIVVVYDITNKESFDHVDMWMKEIHKFTDDNHVRVLVVGNKCDMEEKREIPTSLAREYCNQRGMKVVETSAKTATRVNTAFIDMAEEILENRQKFAENKPKELDYSGETSLNQASQSCEGIMQSCFAFIKGKAGFGHTSYGKQI